MALRQQWVFLPKQLSFFLDESRECLYSGAVRGGKTIALCRKIYKRALHRGAREFLARKEAVTLKATTLKTLLEGDGLMPPVIPPGTYRHNKVEQEIRLDGGGEIVYFGLDSPTKIGSRTLSGGGVDEASEINREDWAMLFNRASLEVPGITRQVNYACNPGPPEHWLAHRFGIVDASLRQPGCSLHTTKTADNFFLPKDYEAELARAYGPESLTYKRLVLGMWVGREGLVFSNFDRDLHLVDRSSVTTWARTIVAVDDGIKDPFVAGLISRDALGALHVRAVRYGHGLTSPEKEALIRRLVGSDRIEAVVVDPSAAQLKTDLAAAGWPVHDAANAVLPGIERVISALVLHDGVPGLTFDPSCARSADCMETAPPHGQEPRSLVGEVESYGWRDRSGTIREVPEHPWSHGPDMLRYGVSHFQYDPVQIF